MPILKNNRGKAAQKSTKKACLFSSACVQWDYHKRAISAISRICGNLCGISM